MEPWALIAVALLVVLLGALALTYLPAVSIKRSLKAHIVRRSQGCLALTFDDGPGSVLTPPLLALLRDYGAKASFYLVGFRAERHPDSVDAIAAQGHELGNHTHWHRHAWRTLPWLAVRDVHQGYNSMSRWMPSGAPFRPPFGKLTYWTFRAAMNRRADVCFWTHDGGDTWPTLPDPQSVVEQVARDGGGVVLLHSHDRGEERQRYVLAVTECLLRAARDRRWHVCTMSEILHAPRDSDTCSAAPVKGKGSS